MRAASLDCKVPVIVAGCGERSGTEETIDENSFIFRSCAFIVPGEYPDTQKKEGQMALAPTTSAATPLPHPTTTWPSPRFSGGDVAVPPSRAASASASLSNRACSAPERLHNALAYQSPSPDEEGDVQGVLQFPHGTEVVFRCIDGAGGERSTWKLLCEDGSWLGRPEKCGTTTVAPRVRYSPSYFASSSRYYSYERYRVLSGAVKWL